jgi:hypothetical protein
MRAREGPKHIALRNRNCMAVWLNNELDAQTNRNQFHLTDTKSKKRDAAAVGELGQNEMR